MSQLILLRHGQSKWNELNLFTGWVDVPLSEKGIDEALAAGKALRDIPIDMIVTSTLIRAQMTAMLVMSVHASGKVPVILHPGKGKLDEWSKNFSEDAGRQTIPVLCAWELNERMYGELQGLDKQQTAEKFGAEQVKKWRRSFDIAPPNGESLAMTAARSIPYFEEKVIPMLQKGWNVFISAHGNSLRSIIMDLEGMSKEQIVELEIPTGLPIIYHYHEGKFTKKS